MEKSNQLPKTEGCLAEGEPVDLWFYRVERPSRSVSREKREPQAGPASCLSNSASKVPDASGDGVCLPEPNTETPAQGEGVEGLPGSKSVARAEGDARNRGGPESPCRTNCEGQAGRAAQRQEAPPELRESDRLHSIQRQGASPEAGEGANRSTQSAQATSAVRTTEQTGKPSCGRSKAGPPGGGGTSPLKGNKNGRGRGGPKDHTDFTRTLGRRSALICRYGSNPASPPGQAAPQASLFQGLLSASSVLSLGHARSTAAPDTPVGFSGSMRPLATRLWSSSIATSIWRISSPR